MSDQLPPMPEPQWHDCDPLNAAHTPFYTADQLRAYAEEAVRLERERVKNDQRAHDDAAQWFHQVLCTGDARQGCARIATLRSRNP